MVGRKPGDHRQQRRHTFAHIAVLGRTALSRSNARTTRRRSRAEKTDRHCWNTRRRRSHPQDLGRCRQPRLCHGRAEYPCRSSQLRAARHRGCADNSSRPKASAMERRQPGWSDRGDINWAIELHNAHRRKLRQLPVEGRRLMQRQAQALAPRGGEIQITRPPAAPRAREFSPRPKIAVEARPPPKRPNHADVPRQPSSPISGFPRGP